MTSHLDQMRSFSSGDRRAGSKPERQAGAGAPEVQLVAAEQPEGYILQRVQVADVAVEAHSVSEKHVEAAADIVTERVLVERKVRGVELRMRPDQTEADQGIRLDGTSGYHEHQIAHYGQHRV